MKYLFRIENHTLCRWTKLRFLAWDTWCRWWEQWSLHTSASTYACSLWIEINYFFLSVQFQVNTDLHTSLNTLLRWQCQKMNLWHSIAKLTVFQVCNRYSLSDFHAPTLFNILVLLDVQANLSETSPFFVCPNGFFQMFIVCTCLGCITLELLISLQT